MAEWHPARRVPLSAPRDAVVATAACLLLSAACGGGSPTPAASIPAPTPSASGSPAAGAGCPSTVTGEGDEPAPVAPPGAPAELEVTAHIDLPAESAFLTVADGAVWATGTDGDVWRIDAASGRITHTVKFPGLGWARPAYGEDSIWLAAMETGQLFRLDPGDGEVQAAIPLEASERPLAIAFDGGRVWVANQTRNTVTAVDAATNTVVDEVNLSEEAPGSPDRAPSSMAVVDGDLWVVEHRADALARLGPTLAVTRICIGSPDPGGIAAAAGALWIGDAGAVVSVVDPSSGVVSARLGLPGVTAGDIVSSDDMVWVGAGSAVVGIDSRTSTVTVIAPLDALADDRVFPGGVAVGVSPESIWTTDPGGDGLVRISWIAAD